MGGSRRKNGGAVKEDIESNNMDGPAPTSSSLHSPRHDDGRMGKQRINNERMKNQRMRNQRMGKKGRMTNDNKNSWRAKD